MFLFLVAASSVAGCESKKLETTGPGDPPVPTFIQLQSETGDNIGAAKSSRYTNANAVITVRATVARLFVRITGDQWWDGEFRLPAGSSQIQRGSYTDITGLFPPEDPAKAGMNWSSKGRGCNAITGSFTVDSVTYAAGALAAVDLRFEQRCGTQGGLLRGTIHWRADDATTAPDPDEPDPTGLNGGG